MASSHQSHANWNEPSNTMNNYNSHAVPNSQDIINWGFISADPSETASSASCGPLSPVSCAPFSSATLPILTQAKLAHASQVTTFRVAWCCLNSMVGGAPLVIKLLMLYAKPLSEPCGPELIRSMSALQLRAAWSERMFFTRSWVSKLMLGGRQCTMLIRWKGWIDASCLSKVVTTWANFFNVLRGKPLVRS